jgi:hypothetical protein
VSQDTENPTAEAQPEAAEPSVPAEGADRPELYVAAAFAGAFLFARILKRIVE